MSTVDAQLPPEHDAELAALLVGLSAQARRVRRVAAIPAPPAAAGEPPPPEVLDFLVGLVHLAARCEAWVDQLAAAVPPPPEAPPAPAVGRLWR